MSGPGYKASLPEHVRGAFAALKAGAEAGRLAHGYVITCPRMEWGTELATVFLQWLYCNDAEKPCGHCRNCRHVESRVHPDIIWIEPESKSRVIKTDAVRDLNHFISQTSFEGGWKAGVILDAHRLYENAANAFLKTLEEPPPNCLILLVTDSPQTLLPTILSRCQRVMIGDDAAGGASSEIELAMLDWLQRRGDRASPITQAAWIQAILKEVQERAEKDEKEQAAEGTDKDLIEARVRSRVIQARMEVLRVLYRWERDVMTCVCGGPEKVMHYGGYADALKRQGEGRTLAQALKRLEDVEYAARLLEGNVPETSVWEAVLPV